MRLFSRSGRRLRDSERLQSFLERLFAGYCEWVHRTTRWSYEGTAPLEDDIAHGRSRLVCLWHSRLALAVHCRVWHGDPFAILASYHRDAQILTEGLKKHGIDTIPLKTRGDNGPAMRDTVRRMKNGTVIGMTPDGPMGPREKVKSGALMAAALAGVEVHVMAWSTSRRIRLGTWDRFVLPLPYGRGVYVMEYAFTPPRRMDEQTQARLTAELEAKINEVTARADRMVDEGITAGPQPARRRFREALPKE